MKKIAIIPARYNSERLPGKPLAKIGNQPMIYHVYDKVLNSYLFDRVLVATDHTLIHEYCDHNNIEVIMTSVEHKNGTSRCAEVIKELNDEFDIVVNVQGDEPFITKKALEDLLSVFNNHEVEIATLVKKSKNIEQIKSSDTAKVVFNKNRQALYFSRNLIPAFRDYKNYSDDFILETVNLHVGLYGFRTEVLKEIVELPITELEEFEKLEQLRWLYNGYKIFVAETSYEGLSVDTKEDLLQANNLYNSL